MCMFLLFVSKDIMEFHGKKSRWQLAKAIICLALYGICVVATIGAFTYARFLPLEFSSDERVVVGCCCSCSPPAAENALVVNYQF